MLMLDEVLADQRDLDLLCARKPPETSEFYEWNDIYGIAAVLKLYSGLSQSVPTRVVIPHGIYLNDTIVADAERDCDLPAVWCYPEYRKALYLRETSKCVLDAAAPFLYADRLVSPHAAHTRTGTLVFPAHSTRTTTAHQDYDALARRVVELPAEYHPIRVCIYWRDVELGHHQPFLSHGLELVSAGYSGDPRFLLRLAHLLRMHERVLSNEVGSHAFFSVAAGCRFSYLLGLEAEHTSITSDGSVYHVPAAGCALPYLRPFLALEWDARVGSQQWAAATYMLGASHLKAPEGVAADLHAARQLDRWGPRLVQSTGFEGCSRAGLVPTGILRCWTRARRFARDSLPRLAPRRLIPGLVRRVRNTLARDGE